MKESRESTLSQHSNKSIEINTQKNTGGDMNLRSSMGMNEDLFKHESVSGTKSKSRRELLRESVRDKEEKEELAGVELKDVERVLERAAADRGRSALFYRVRDAVKLYRNEKDPERKENLLLAVRECAFNYLLEKKGNAPERKQICFDIVKTVDAYARNNGIKTERNLDYLVDDVNISDRTLDMEIMLADKLTLKSSESFSGNLSDRRKAFRRKIKDVRFARRVIADLKQNQHDAFDHIEWIKGKYVIHENDRTEGYDEAVKHIVAAYMNLSVVNTRLGRISIEDADDPEMQEENRKTLGTNMFTRLSVSDDNREKRLDAKGHMIEGIFADIMSWNLNDFAFKEPADFLKSSARGKAGLVRFMDLYNKLQIAGYADVLMNELEALKSARKIKPTMDSVMLKEVKARISLCKEIKKEYANRALMMNSPYYALLLREDTKSYDTPDKLNDLTKDRQINGAGIRLKKSVGASFKEFIGTLVSKSKRLISGRKTGGEFTRGSDIKKLVKWHRNKSGATITIPKKNYVSMMTEVGINIDADNDILMLSGELKKAAEINGVHEEDADNLIIENNDIKINEQIIIDEPKEEAEEPRQEEIIEPVAVPVQEEDPAVLAAREEEQKKAAFRDAIRGKQSEISAKAGARSAEIDAGLESKSRARMKAQLEEDAKKAAFQNAIKDKRSAITSKSAAWLEKLEDAQAKQADERIQLSYLLEGYDNLKKSKATMEEAYELRSRMIKKLIAYSGVENGVIEFTPIDELAGFVKYAMENQFAEGMGKKLAKQIRDLDDSYADTEDDTELLKRMDSLLAKGDKMTVQDKLLAYDYSTLLICMNKSKEAGDIKYDDYKEFGLDVLARYARQASEYRATQPAEDEEFDELTPEQLEAHRRICLQILSEYTGENEAFLRVMRIQDLSHYAEEIHDIVDKDKSRLAGDGCLRLAGRIHDLNADIDRALEANDRDTLLSTIEKLAGVRSEELDGYTSIDLRDMLMSMYANTNDLEELKRTTGNLITEYNKLLTPEYYANRLKEFHRNVWLKRDFGDEADFEDLRAMAEYSVIILKQHQGLDKLGLGDFNGLNADEIYRILTNIGIIEGLKGTTDPYEQNDVTKAVREMAGMNMSTALRSALEQTLGISFAKMPEYVATGDEKASVVVGKVKLKTWKRNEWQTKADKATAEHVRALYIRSVNDHEGLENLGTEFFSELSTAEIDELHIDLTVIENLVGTKDKPVSAKITEAGIADLVNAVIRLDRLKMSDELRYILGSKLNAMQIPGEVRSILDPILKDKFTPKPPVQDQSKDKKKDKKNKKKPVEEKPVNQIILPAEEEKHEETEEHKAFMQVTESYQRQLDKLAAAKKKRVAAKVESEEDRTFSKDASMLLDIIGDLTLLSGEAALDSALDKKIRFILFNRSEDLAKLLAQGDNKMLTLTNAFAEIKSSVTTGEKKFFESCENNLMPVIDALSKAISESKDKKITSMSIDAALKSGKINDALKRYAGKLNADMDIFEKEMLPVMTEAVSDIYNRGEGNDALADVTELMDDDMKTIVGQIAEETKKARLAAAKNTRERLEAAKKTEDQTQKERIQLNDMQEKLLFDKKKGQGRFNQLLVSGYYKNASRADQRKMLSYVIKDLKKNGTSVTSKEKGCEYFASTMKGAGPLMQKMMQGIPERMVIPEMAGALGVVKSSLAHIDPEYVNKVLEEMKKDTNGAVQYISKPVSLGAASVAETFKCTIKGPGIPTQDVVVKILRPDAEANMKKDLEFVRKAAMFADMSDEQVAQYEKKYGNKFVNHNIHVTESGFLAQYSEIRKEFDFTNEAENIGHGQDNYIDKYNQKKDGSDNYHVKSVQINENFTPHRHYLVMDLAKGTTVDKVISQAKGDLRRAQKTFRNTDPSIKDEMVINSENIGEFWNIRKNLTQSSSSSTVSGKLCGKLAYVWLEQALFGSKAVGLGDDPNFHHGDLHAGNIMVDGKDSTILDYGNAVILKDSKVNQILSMLSAVVINHSKYFVEAFNNMLILSAKDEAKSTEKVGYAPLTKEQQEAFVAELDKLFKLGTAADSGKKILIALNVAQSLGVKLPKEIQNFSQCQQRLENTVQEVKDCALRTTAMVDTIDNLNIAPEDADSFDPLMKLFRFHQNPENRSQSKIKEFAAQYAFESADFFINDAAKATTREALDNVINGQLPLYSKLKNSQITPEKSRAMAAKWRETFREVQEEIKQNGRVSKKKADAISLCGRDLMDLAIDTDFFNSYLDQETFCNLLAAAFNDYSGSNYDADAFEKLMVIMEDYIPSLMGSVDAMYGSLSEVSKDIEVERARRVKVQNLANTAFMMKTVSRPEAAGFRMRLKGSKTGDGRKNFERQAARMLKSHEFNRLYKLYREAEAALDKLAGSDDKEAVAAAEAKLKDTEDKLVFQFMQDTSETLEKIANGYDTNLSLETIKDEDVLPDFVEVMGTVVDIHWKRTAGKVNKALGNEIRKRSKEQDKIASAIKKEDEAEAKKLKDEEEAAAKKKKAEEEAAAKKKKAEEAAAAKKKKEEEKKKKKEEEAAKKKAAKAGKKKK